VLACKATGRATDKSSIVYLLLILLFYSFIVSALLEVATVLADSRSNIEYRKIIGVIKGKELFDIEQIKF
jgi:hypothetical protein